jgi:selenocysteine-specific elongation factor
LLVGDRAVLRDPGRHAVLAGIEVLVVDPPSRRHLPPRQPDPTAYSGRSAALLGWLADHPLQAPSRDQLDAWGLTPRDLADAAGRGDILRLAGVVLAGDALVRAETAVRTLGHQFTVGEAARAMGTSRRVAVPLLERLDTARVTRRLADGQRTLGPGSARPREVRP